MAHDGPQSEDLGTRAQIDTDITKGTLPVGTDANGLAGFAMAVLSGLAGFAMAVLSGLAGRAREGAPRPELERIAHVAAAAIPRDFLGRS